MSSISILILTNEFKEENLLSRRIWYEYLETVQAFVLDRSEMHGQLRFKDIIGSQGD